MKVLVIAAHPDDEVLGCGATMARLAAEGHRVEVLIVAEGATSRPGHEADDVSSLRECARAAAAVLGASEVHFGGLPDNRLDAVPLLEVVQLIEGVLSEVRPDVVLTHHDGDLNVDHRVVSNAVLTACRPMAGSRVTRVYLFEVASSTEWAFHRMKPSFEPNVFVDVNESVGAKQRALECYASEMRGFPHPRSSENIAALATTRGAAAGLRRAEAFELVFALQRPGAASPL